MKEIERLIIDTANNLHMMNEKDLKKRFIELRSILTERALDTFAEALSKQIGVSVEEIENNSCEEILRASNNSWINLDIDNLPKRFFTRDDIEIEGHGDFDIELDGSYKWRKEYLNLENRPCMIKNINIGYKYRYRIQDKKTIQITAKIKSDLLDLYTTIENCFDVTLSDILDREVIIID